MYFLSTFRTLGTAATPQNLFSLENSVGSLAQITIDYLEVVTDSTGVLLTVAPNVRVSRPASLPTGGTVLTAVKSNSNFPAPVAIARGGTASDGGVATAITATAGSIIISKFISRIATAIGSVSQGNNLILVGPSIQNNSNIILNANESILVQGVTASAATTHFCVNISWTGSFLSTVST